MKVSWKSLALDITNIYRNVQNPIWPFVFQKNQSNDQQKDNDTIDHANVQNLWIELGGKRCPEESLNLDSDSNYYCMAYNAFLYFKRISIKSDSIPYTDKKEFKNNYPIYSIDLSDQPQATSDAKSNIILHAEFNKAVSAPGVNEEGTVCYTGVVSNCMLIYEPAKNKITQKNN